MSAQNKLEQNYYNPKFPGSYSGLSSLIRNAHSIDKGTIKRWLSKQDTYTLHKTPRRRFPRRKIIVSGIDDQWQADLIDLSRLKKHNKGYTFILTVIDVFSKVAWAIPLKQKTGAEIVRAFEKIFKTSKRHPQKIQTDKGSEFLNKTFQSYLKKKKVHFFVTENEDIKAAVVERFNRTLKEKMWRYFTKHNTLYYLDVLSDLVVSYNHSFHRSIKRAPATVNRKNQQQVWMNLYGDQLKISRPVYKKGDKVRICSGRRHFKKGYLPSWTQEIFTITKVNNTHPPTYQIIDEQNEPIKGAFYKQELQKIIVPQNKLYKIEKVISQKGRGKTLKLFVKWEGYPPSHNSWISASQVERV